MVSHCRDVAATAVRLASELCGRGLDVDVGLVEVGALLHDLGRARTHDIDHGVVGGEMAQVVTVEQPIEFLA